MGRLRGSDAYPPGSTRRGGVCRMSTLLNIGNLNLDMSADRSQCYRRVSEALWGITNRSRRSFG
jgi:hypothetical protein